MKTTNNVLETRVQNLEAAQAEMNQKLDAILALLQDKPVSSGKEPKKATKKSSTKNANSFVEHLARLHNRTDEEKAAAKAAWHEFYDAKWATWRAEADAKGLKGEARKAANKAKNAELVAEWKALKG